MMVDRLYGHKNDRLSVLVMSSVMDKIKDCQNIIPYCIGSYSYPMQFAGGQGNEALNSVRGSLLFGPKNYSFRNQL